MHFSHLRKDSWRPTFTWLPLVPECADQINSFHEDYPKYVPNTKMVIDKYIPAMKIFIPQIKIVHRYIFSDVSFGGEWRKVEVVVGDHRPPHYCPDRPL